MEKFVSADSELKKLFAGGKDEWIRSPDSAKRSTARHHGDFDYDKATVAATLQRIAGGAVTSKLCRERRSAAVLRAQRSLLE